MKSKSSSQYLINKSRDYTPPHHLTRPIHVHHHIFNFYMNGETPRTFCCKHIVIKNFVFLINIFPTNCKCKHHLLQITINLPICVSSMCCIKSPKLGNVIPQPLNLQIFSKKTAMSLQKQTAESPTIAALFALLPHKTSYVGR